MSEKKMDVNDEEVTVVYTYEPGDPGNTSGLPENCYPPEPDGVEIEKIIYNGIDVLQVIHEKYMEKLEKELLEACKEESRYDDYPDYDVEPFDWRDMA